MIDAAELKTIFEKDYNRTEWLHALRKIFYIKNLLAIPEPVDLPSNDFGAIAHELGHFETSEGLLIGLYEVSISPQKRLDRIKSGLRNLMRTVYKRDVDAALIVFTQGASWRFSYASELTVVNKETGKREKRQTDPKRYTYLLGRGQHCRTAAERFASLKTSTNLIDKKISIKEIENAFSVDILTKDFYRELSNWYFWALNHVTFPDDDQPIAETRNPINLIRLITRLIFVWFLKQKGLVPHELFDREKIWPHLNVAYQPGSTYYKAILQNLFFATLNQEMDKRVFRKNGQNYNITNLFRYKQLFRNPDQTIELFKNIPFLNGGLFECLDKPHPTEKTPQGNEKIVRIDGYSDRPDNPLSVPDYLFFGGARAVDLSMVCDDSRQRNVNIRGIIEILNSYNFTVEENTPLEIQVALDPELLGKVFENLLASYNPETKTTARKQTGSFYTPREIVNYMVDESLIAWLKQKLSGEPNHDDEETEARLRELVSYSGNGNPFNDAETQALVKAIDEIKVLDPASGSGAFPMGVLQQLVHVLQKLDPDNRLWKQMQMQRANTEIQEAIASGDTVNFAERLKEIADAFENNAEDYGRKLYLIENCIYGVDIQPIAVQIAKLRFFISLLVDQTINPEAENLGIKALPNLETKFVAANSLIPIYRYGVILRSNEIMEKENALEKIRHKYFTAKTPDQKRKMRNADEKLREQIASIIVSEAMNMIEGNKQMLERKDSEYRQASREIIKLKHPTEIEKFTKRLKKLAIEVDNLRSSIINPDFIDNTAKLLANWNPYEQNKSADFFDSEWMFGVKEGFDIVLGNPPYLLISKQLFKEKYANFYKLQQGKPDLYRIFLELSFNVLKKYGISTFITPNTFLTIPSAEKIRHFFINQTKIISIVNYDQTVFESASVNNIVYIVQYCKPDVQTWINVYDLTKDVEFNRNLSKSVSQTLSGSNKRAQLNIFVDNEILHIINKFRSSYSKLSDLDMISLTLGLQPYHNTLHSASQMHERFLHSKTRVSDNHFLELGGKNVHRFYIDKKSTNYLDYTKELYTKPDFVYFCGERIVIREIVSDTLTVGIVNEDLLFNKSCYIIKSKNETYDHKVLLALLNSKAIGFFVQNIGDKSKQKLFPRVTMNTLKELPIPAISIKNKIELIELVEKIIAAKQSSHDIVTSEFENRIDELVFKLYGLTYEEVKVIAPDFWLGEDEYERIKVE